MELVALPAFTDNYIWMIHNGENAIVVDPGDATVVISALQAHQLSLEAILVTHRHADHTHGLPALHAMFGGLPVYGPAHETILGVTHFMAEGDQFTALGLQWAVWDTPGHTAGHITYMAPSQEGLPCPQGLVFCGDTLFSAGCGRLYDGTHAQLANSLQRLSSLPAQTWLCPTHEYTVSNLMFAAAVEPHNPAIAQAHQRSAAQRQAGQPTLPTTVEQENSINPFVRTHQSAVIAQALAHGATDASPVAVFTALRLWKDQFTS
jgi:hydroxyacylglutathione hydrolase